MQRICLFVASGIFLMVSPGAAAAPTRFEFKDAGLRNLLCVISDAPVEKMIGLSNAVDGWIQLNPQKVREGIKGSLTADLRTLETGSEARNELIRDKILQTSENATVNYEIVKLINSTADTFKRDAPTVVKVEGVLKIRGIAKPLSTFFRLNYLPEGEVTKSRLPGNLLKLSAAFDLDLADFGVTMPEGMSNRFARVIQVAFDAVGTDQASSTLVLPIPEGPKPKETRINSGSRAPASEDQ